MKKSRIFSALLVLALLSTCVIGGTFAKYVSTASGTEQARIAKWGFEAPEALTIDLFDAEYTHVKSGDTTNVVAPGTSKTATIELATITGSAPEVDYTYGVTLTYEDTTGTIEKLDSLQGWKWTYKAPGATDAVEYTTFADLKTAVDKNETVTAGNLPSGYGTSGQIEIGWVWSYETGALPATVAANDVEDTKAGNLAAGGTLGIFTITLTVGATQID